MKMKAALILATLFLTSCAGQRVVQDKVNHEIKNEIVLKPEAAGEASRELIKNSQVLTPLQKSKLLDLQTQTREKSMALTEELEKAKVVLVKTILNPQFDKREYNILKKKITKLDNSRLKIGFDAITEAINIITPEALKEDKQYYDLMFHFM